MPANVTDLIGRGCDCWEMHSRPHGFAAVSTHIQSGNVLFESGTSRDSLETEIEGMLERRVGVPLVVVVRSHHQLRSVIDNAPAGFGEKPKTRRQVNDCSRRARRSE